MRVGKGRRRQQRRCDRRLCVRSLGGFRHGRAPACGNESVGVRRALELSPFRHREDVWQHCETRPCGAVCSVVGCCSWWQECAGIRGLVRGLISVFPGVLTCGHVFCAGFNVETVEYKNISFTVWDVGGQDKVNDLSFLSCHPS